MILKPTDTEYVASSIYRAATSFLHLSDSLRYEDDLGCSDLYTNGLAKLVTSVEYKTGQTNYSHSNKSESLFWEFSLGFTVDSKHIDWHGYVPINQKLEHLKDTHDIHTPDNDDYFFFSQYHITFLNKKFKPLFTLTKMSESFDYQLDNINTDWVTIMHEFEFSHNRIHKLLNICHASKQILDSANELQTRNEAFQNLLGLELNSRFFEALLYFLPEGPSSEHFLPALVGGGYIDMQSYTSAKDFLNSVSYTGRECIHQCYSLNTRSAEYYDECWRRKMSYNKPYLEDYIKSERLSQKLDHELSEKSGDVIKKIKI